MARVALLIGVSNYGQGFQSLPETPGDVNAMQRVLGNPAIGGFHSVKSLIDPDPFQMLEAIEETFTQCSPEDLVLLFFSGHGIKDESGALYFGTKLTRKTERGNLLKSSAVPVKQVHDLINQSPAAQQLIIVDCCFSGAFADSLSLEIDRCSVETLFEPLPQERVILTSSTAAQYSLTSMQYSYKQLGLDLSTYTRYLVEGIETGAADQDGDGWISVSELHEYTQHRVQIATPAMEPRLYARERGTQIRLARSPQPGSELIYRREVIDWINQGEISPAGQQALELRRHQLQLSAETARGIEADVLRPHREHQQRVTRYKQALLEAIQREHILSQDNQQRLERLRQVLGLSEDSVAMITAQLEEYGRCLQRYQQALVDVVQREYPLDHYADQEMQRLQRVLGLTNKDTVTIVDRVEEYRRRLQYYERALVETIQQEYPLTPASRSQLERLQEMLDLTHEDVLSIVERVEEYKRRLHQYHQEVTDTLLENLSVGNTTSLPLWQSILNLPDAPPATDSASTESTSTQPPVPAEQERNSDPATSSSSPENGAGRRKDPPNQPSNGFKTTLQSGDSIPPIGRDLEETAVPDRTSELPLYLYSASQNAPPIEQRIAQESFAIKSDHLGNLELAGFVSRPVERSPAIEQTPPLTPETTQAPTSTSDEPSLLESLRNNMSAAALVGVLLGILLGGLGCLMIINFFSNPQPTAPPVKSTVSPNP